MRIRSSNQKPAYQSDGKFYMLKVGCGRSMSSRDQGTCTGHGSQVTRCVWVRHSAQCGVGEKPPCLHNISLTHCLPHDFWKHKDHLRLRDILDIKLSSGILSSFKKKCLVALTRWILGWPPWGLRGGSGCGCLAHAGLEKSIFWGSSETKKVLAKSMQKNERFSVWWCFHLKGGGGEILCVCVIVFSCGGFPWKLWCHDLWKLGSWQRCAESQLVAWCAERSLVTWTFWKTMDDGQKLQGEWQLFLAFFQIMKSQRISTLKGYWWIIWPLATEGSNLLYNFGTTNWVKSLSSTSNLQWLM